MMWRVILFWLLGASLGWADLPRHVLMPRDDIDGLVSSNWIAAVKAALPAKYFGQGNLSFQQTTNLLREETQQGNNAAQLLWAFVLLSQSQSQPQTMAGLALLRDSAEKGYAPAMYHLGLLFENARYVDLNYEEAFHWFNLAADKGSSGAQIQLGGCYHYGLGIGQDSAMAVKCYRRAAEQTNYVAMKCLGYVLLEGIGTEKDVEAAKFWFTRAAKEGGNRRAMYNLGAISNRKFPDTNSMGEAFHWFEKSAALGDALACAQLANFYYRGWGVVNTNIESYRYWRLMAATLGATDSQYFMGAACRTGDGVPKDLEASLRWYRKAAAKNHPSALYDLALHYLEDKTNRASMMLANDYMFRAAQGGHLEAQYQYAMSCFRGDVTAKDCDKGKQWLTRAAENGWAKAEYSLFQLYYHGIAPAPECPAYPKDEPEAIKWLRRAADHGHLPAQSILAVMLIRWKIAQKDNEEPQRLLRSAAEHGYAQGQNDLGFAIQHGDLGPVDFVQSAMWCRLAQAGSRDSNILQRATVNLTSALSRLSADQRLEVDRRVKEFRVLPAADIAPLQKDWEKNPAYEQEDGNMGH